MALFLAAFSSPAGAAARKPKKVAEVTFVTSIDCKNCVRKVEANLPFEKGVLDMKVTLADKTVWVKFDAVKTSVEALSTAIEKLGYTAQVVQAETVPAKQ